MLKHILKRGAQAFGTGTTIRVQSWEGLRPCSLVLHAVLGIGSIEQRLGSEFCISLPGWLGWIVN